MDKPKDTPPSDDEREAFAKQTQCMLEAMQQSWKQFYQNPALLQQMMQSMSPSAHESSHAPHASSPVAATSIASLDAVWDALRDLERRMAQLEGRLARLEADASK